MVFVPHVQIKQLRIDSSFADRRVEVLNGNQTLLRAHRHSEQCHGGALRAGLGATPWRREGVSAMAMALSVKPLERTVEGRARNVVDYPLSSVCVVSKEIRFLSAFF